MLSGFVLTHAELLNGVWFKSAYDKWYMGILN